MLERGASGRDESDKSYFDELLYLGEFITKLLILEILAASDDDPNQNRYSIQHAIVRADGVGEWSRALRSSVIGPTSLRFLPSWKQHQNELTIKHAPGSESWQRKSIDLLNKACRLYDPDVNDISKRKESFLYWPDQFAWLRNKTRGHGAPRPEDVSQLCLPLQDSIDQIASNAPAFRHSWAVLKKQISGKYRISSFGGDKTLFQYLAREGNHILSDGPYVFIGEPRRVPLLYTEPDLRDFFLPNGDFRNNSFEVISYITNDRHREDGNLYVLPPHGLPVSETSPATGLSELGRSLTNMPPQRHGYTKRLELESQILSLLNDERNSVITLHGPGGIGKTSTALTVLHKLAETRSCYIIWFSARDIDLLPEGPRIVRPDALSIEDLTRSFSCLMKPGESFKQHESEEYFTHCLSSRANDKPFIFVFDNFETIKQQRELYAYVYNAVRHPNKVLITTRSRESFKGDYPVNVSGMTRDEFKELVHKTSVQFNISSFVDDEYVQKIYEESGGHPYVTKILLGEVAIAGEKIDLRRIAATQDEMLDALFDRSFEALSTISQRIFLILCNWRSLTPQVALEAILLRPGNERVDVENAIEELQQFSLIERSEADDCTYLSVPAAATPFGQKKLATSFTRILVEADITLLQGFGDTGSADQTHGLSFHIDSFARHTAETAGNEARQREGIAILEYIASGFPYAWLRVADIYEEAAHDAKSAIHAVNRYLEAVPDDKRAWRKALQLYAAVGNVLGEINARIRLSEFRDSEYSELSTAANYVNTAIERGAIAPRSNECQLILDRLRGLMQSRSSEANADDLARLAQLFIQSGDNEDALYWVDRGLILDPQNDSCHQLKESLQED